MRPLFTCRLVLLFGLAGCTQSETIVEECVGFLNVTARLSPVPDKLRVVWSSSSTGEVPAVVIDDCSTPVQSNVAVIRRASGVTINEGGFGYTVPVRFDLQIFDLGDCATAPRSVVDARGTQVTPQQGAGVLCGDGNVEL
jgi:hypothetical protein